MEDVNEEATLVPYCDLCPSEKRVRATSACSICGKDTCPDHCYPVAVPRQEVPGSLKKRFESRGSTLVSLHARMIATI
jgi:hypothetical protein